jgi:hypothetical protein
MSVSEAGTDRPGVGVGPTTEFSLFFRVKAGEGETMRCASRPAGDSGVPAGGLWNGCVDDP